MAKIRESSFYYGSFIDTIMSNEIKPVLVSNGDKRKIYDFMTNDITTYLFLKYRSAEQRTLRQEYKSWQFTFGEEERNELKSFVERQDDIHLVFICGAEKLNESEYCILYKKEIADFLSTGKTSLTISRFKGEHNFRINKEKSREAAIQIPANRDI